MSDKSYLGWPFFEPRHRDLADALAQWAAAHAGSHADGHDDAGAVCRRLVAAMGKDGWLRYAVPQEGESFDLRALCLIREILAWHSGLADFAFAMQGLGTASLTLFGTPEQRARWLPGPRNGATLTGFALSERHAGSDVAAMQMTARPVAGGFVLDGAKTWISNGGIAGQYVVFARDDAKYTAFVLGADARGLTIGGRIDVIAPHPMASLEFRDCFVPADAVIGSRGAGMRVALGTLDIFRPSVGAAALGLARRALEEALKRASERSMFAGKLADLQLTQVKLADMALKVDLAALAVYRAAWTKDVTGPPRITREAAMAKLYATEAAQQVIDDAVQIWGAEGVRNGSVVESLYREIRAMRIYEGASEVQKIVIARALLKPA